MNTLPLIDRCPDDRVVVRLDGRCVSASGFVAQVAALKARLPQARYALNLCEDRYHFMLGFAAAIAAGQTNLLPANRLPATVERLRQAYPDSYVLDDAGPAGCIASGDLPDGEPPPPIPGEHLAAIVFTSGSTGAPKPIEKSWRTIVDSTRLNARELGVAKTPAELLVTVPPQHMYGLETSVLLPWFAPLTICRARPFFADDIARALAAMTEPRILVSTPVHLRVLAQARQQVPAIDRIWSATAPLDRALAICLENKYGAAVTEIYGCSETGCLARRRPTQNSNWQPFAPFELRQRDDEVIAQAPHLPEPVRLHDRLEIHADGRFQLLGRGSELINIAGKRISLAELNRCLLEIPGVVDGVIFEPPAADVSVQRLAALVVAPALSVKEIRKGLCSRLDGAFIPRPIRKVDALPRAGTGKLCRQAVLELFAESEA